MNGFELCGGTDYRWWFRSARDADGRLADGFVSLQFLRGVGGTVATWRLSWRVGEATRHVVILAADDATVEDPPEEVVELVQATMDDVEQRLVGHPTVTVPVVRLADLRRPVA